MLLQNSKEGFLSKDKIEKIQKKKTEYKLLGTFSRTRGLRLFSYNPITNNLEELVIKYSNEAHMFHNGDCLDWYDPSTSRVNIDSKNIHFEALNMTSAKRRVKKFKLGELRDLFNLKPRSNKKITF